MVRHLGWKFVDAKLQRRGYQFKVGQWTNPIDNPIPCVKGYHWCRSPRDLILDYREYGPVVLQVEALDGIDHGTKTVSSQLYVHRVATWDDRIARLWAADCAEHVLHHFESKHPKDQRPRLAIEAARKYALGAIGATARAAARDAARAAALDAAWAAGDTAGAVEIQWQTDRLTAYLHGWVSEPVKRLS